MYIYIIKLNKGNQMLTIKQIQDRLKENISEQEESFLYDQLWEIQMIANDVNSSALYAMNGGESHV